MTGPRLAPRRAVRHARAALGITWRAAPTGTAADLLLAILAGVTPVLVAALTKLVLDRLSGGRPADASLALLGVGLAVTAAAGVVLPHLRGYVEKERIRAVSRLVRRRLYDAVLRLVGLVRLEDPEFQDRLQAAQQTGHLGPTQLTGNALGAVQSLLALSGFLGVLLVLSPTIGLLVLAAALPTLWMQLRLNRARVAMVLHLEHFQRRDFFFAQLLVGVPAAKEVRLFGLGRFFGDRMLDELHGMHRVEQRLDRRELWAQGLLGLLGAGVAGAGVVYTVTAAAGGRLTAGDVVLYLAAVPGVQGALGGLVGQFGAIHQALLLFDHYDQVIRAEPDLPAPPTARPVPPLRDGIELRDVWFRYSPRHPWVLRGVDLFLPAGGTTALVGLNGAGKSTLVKLLCRFYDPERGTIRWDGTDLREFDPAELRQRLGAVFQDFMPYDLSAAENIALGDLDARDDPDRLRAAARQAGIDEALTALPRGYDTLLTRIFFDGPDRDDPQAGVVLSGGQWQRVALARGFLRADRDLLILDEPSSGLDAEAEHDLHTRLRELRRGRTSLLISHRLNAVRDADTIVVLADGRIAECGRHDELLAAGGGYARLFTLQARGYREDAAAPV
ncbi:ABC transporter ATP-binding protein [Micromonospora peucetia]|uniref:ABC transporter ATP-binding protein/permease n=1 Tax=Micromonospora peucetia TaxID=47871 RepID=A0A1C6W5B5_9ACTN|nr:ABC transporter ATP-binding protein [Micromonospora peucetia]WSA32740.1 ABC transporter ATP-binding protein/permease [Micromonospora peucetia]SCL73733.1 ATP-binding cassette, subfamily B [Micromonospora peucetia]